MKYNEIFDAIHTGEYVTIDSRKAGILGPLSKPERAAWKILDDLSDRRGLGQEWDQIDDEIQDEIFETMCGLIADVFKEQP